MACRSMCPRVTEHVTNSHVYHCYCLQGLPVRPFALYWAWMRTTARRSWTTWHRTRQRYMGSTNYAGD